MTQTKLLLSATAVLGLTATGCADRRAEFGPEVVLAAAQRPTEFGVAQAERLGITAMGPASGGQGQGQGGASAAEYAADVPTGWQAQPASEFRQLNFRVEQDGECYLTTRNVRGGRLANVNRWVSMQFGQTPLTDAQFAALPKHVLLGQEALIVEVEGAFSGMGGTKKEGYKLLGLVAGTDDDMQTLKFVGPRDLVDKHRAEFLAFAASIRRGGGGTGSATPAPAPAKPFSAETPPGWQELPGSELRQLNWRVAGNPDAECYLTIGGLRGGRRANANRWINMQFGQPAISAEDFDKLPKAKLLEQDAALVEVEGDFKGMGGEAKKGWKLLGLVGGTDDDMMTLKMTGPKDVVDQERASFLQLAVRIVRGGSAAPEPTPTKASMPKDDAHAGVGQADAAAPFAATIGAGWKPLGDTGSRLLRHRIGEKTECYVGTLGGGLAQMLGIWCGEMSAAVPDEKGIAALPKVAMLGGQATLLELAGNFQSMGGQTMADAKSIVAALELDGAIVFAKCLGPAAEVTAAHDAFLEFVKTLRRTQ